MQPINTRIAFNRDNAEHQLCSHFIDQLFQIPNGGIIRTHLKFSDIVFSDIFDAKTRIWILGDEVGAEGCEMTITREKNHFTLNIFVDPDDWVDENNIGHIQVEFDVKEEHDFYPPFDMMLTGEMKHIVGLERRLENFYCNNGRLDKFIIMFDIYDRDYDEENSNEDDNHMSEIIDEMD